MNGLDFDHEETLPLDRGKYQWISIKRFRFDPALSDRELLEALVTHTEYHDDYAGNGSVNEEPIHGPYKLALITADTFRPGERETAQALLEHWANKLQPEPPESAAHINDSVLALFDTGEVYELPDLRATSQHEWGWVVGLTGFHEYVVIDRRAAVLALIVASDD